MGHRTIQTPAQKGAAQIEGANIEYFSQTAKCFLEKNGKLRAKSQKPRRNDGAPPS
jgi:hypothetical protein